MSANGDRRDTRDGNGGGEDLRRRVDAAIRSLHATASLASGIEEGAARLQSTGNEQAAVAEEVRVSVTAVAGGIEETATAAQELARSQQSVAEAAKTLRELAESGTSALQ